jgi:hypothetical protein
MFCSSKANTGMKRNTLGVVCTADLANILLDRINYYRQLAATND